jgi:hypothetical protein
VKWGKILELDGEDLGRRGTKFCFGNSPRKVKRDGAEKNIL